ncbi:MAG TPA: sugar ABC transporter ATP-binding protein [Acidimicrobiia bacterium]|nr:sugar ABC transporter ATP-binding protein [Acidimicrobiia bacterium]
MSDSPLVRLRGVTKAYPGVVAVDDLDLDIHAGRVHAIVGLNGAGKSTVVNLLAGLVKPDVGRIEFPDRGHASFNEVSLVPQELVFVPGLSVGRNILLGHEGRLTRQSLTKAETTTVKDVLDRVGLEVHPDRYPGECSVPQIRLIQIAKALIARGKVMLLDEPTAVLSPREASRLMERVKALRSQGEAVVYVSHRLSEVLLLGDVITVLKDGRKIDSFRRGEIDRDGLISLLARDQPGMKELQRESLRGGEPVLRVEDLAARGFEGLTLGVRQGEVMALVGLQDAGQSWAVRTLAGLNPPSRGSVRLREEQLDLSSPISVVARGMTLVPAERRTSGVVGSMTVRENVVISPRARGHRWGLRLRRVEQRTSDSYLWRLRVKARRPQLVATLSGGNQQKVAIARALETQPRVLLLDEPTQGIDAATKGEVLRLIKTEARTNAASVIASTSQLDEVPGWADRAVVFRLGQVVAALDGKEITEAALLEHSLS